MNAFDRLSLPCTAALSTESLGEAYSRESRSAHPDHGGTEQSAQEVNIAYDLLRSPEKRLKHLLEVSAPPESNSWRTVPLDDAMMTLFSALGQALEASGRFLERKAKAQTALAKALLASEEMQHRESLESIGFQLEHRRQEMESHLPLLDTALARGGNEEDWMQLASTQARFAYLAKWQTQIRERLLALM
jgi:curved DNA-binding protein CbpA